MMRHTGGLARGATSTRSRSSCRSMARASGNGRIPSCWPSGSTRRTSRARMRSLILVSLAVMGMAMRHHSRRCGPRVSPEPLAEAWPLPSVSRHGPRETRRTVPGGGWGCARRRDPAFPCGSKFYATRREQPLDTRWRAPGQARRRQRRSPRRPSTHVARRRPGWPRGARDEVDPDDAGLDDLGPEEQAELAGRLDELRRQLLGTPAEVVVANHAYGL